ncbi:MAG: hypothetical protein KGH65_05880, partial [Candidatus Micrarchaeota archaeon]|nr:hypothetical protein [Candidatus Micrarchaeota archaeon]
MAESVVSTDTVSASTGKGKTMAESVVSTDTVSVISGKTIGKSLSESIDISTHLAVIGAHEYLVTNETQITVDPAKPNLVVTNSNAPLSSIIVPSTVSNPTLNYGPIQQSNGSINIKNTLTVNSNTSAGNFQVILPSDVTMSGANWNGVVNLPTVQSTTSVILPSESGIVNIPISVIEVGFGSTPITFDRSVQIVFSGQSGKRIGYSYGTGPLTEITTTCGDNTQTTNDGLPSGGNCKIDVGSDLIVWTKHMTTFATFSSQSTKSSQGTPSSTSNGGGGSVGATSAGVGVGTSTSTSNGGGAGPYLKIQDISYDVCDKQIVRIQVATDYNKTDPTVIVRTSISGVVDAKLIPVQPYAQENVNASVRKLVYEAS